MLKKYSPWIILFTICLLPAQHHDGHGRQMPKGCEISGTVIDSTTGLPIEYTSISVVRNDGSIENGGITNAQG